MADGTKIEWADATLNYANGCSVLSPGCTNCYAMKLAGTRLRHHPSRAGLTQDSKAGPVWTGEVRMHDKALEQALAWKRGRRIFWNAHGDLFHENVPDEAIDRLFAVCALTPQHTHMILTKRSARMREYMAGCEERVALLTVEWACATGRTPDDPRPHPALRREGNHGPTIMDAPRLVGFEAWPLPNVWLGVSVEDQERAEERIPDLLATSAAVSFISAEPLLGPLDLSEWLICPNARGGLSMDPSTGAYECCRNCDYTGLIGGIGWAIVGGESGFKARPMHPDWARSLRDQCQAAGIPFLFKQWGEWVDGLDAPFCTGRSTFLREPTKLFMARVGKKAAGRILDGREWNEFPS